MSRIFSCDLGTNSLGWAIRDTDEFENQIVKYGVVVFKKGVGEGKSGEYSLAAERRSNRSKRRLYNSKRYRKWAILKVLLENGMCPISSEELKLWSLGSWQNEPGRSKNRGRVYPSSPDFHSWLAMDFDGIDKGMNERKFKPEFQNPYTLRNSLIEFYNANDKNRLYKIGRAFYHLAQRRGFKTSRKSGKSSYGENEYLEKVLREKPDWRVSQILHNGLANEGRRIRNSGVIQRRYFEEEFYAICSRQLLSAEITEMIYHALYFVRPHRTQKGLVGKCTLEKGKARIPESHPSFEIFRAQQFINNIKWRVTGSKRHFEPIPIALKKRILQDVFFKKIEKGDRKGQVNDRSYFEFSEIVNGFSENHKYEFNYTQYANDAFELKRTPNVSACPVIAGLMNVFSDTWRKQFIEDDNKYGINLVDLNLTYVVKHEGVEKVKRLNYIDIWHLLFDFLQTKDEEDQLKKFCRNVLLWDEHTVQKFSEITIAQGYGSLSFKAIRKIIPFLEEGYIYSDAVSFANLKSALGPDLFNSNKEEAKKVVKQIIEQTGKVKNLLNATNELIQKYFSCNPSTRAKGVDERIRKLAEQEVLNKMVSFFGETEWTFKTETERKECTEFVLQKYLRFLSGEQLKEEKASANLKSEGVLDYYKLPRLDEAIKFGLKTKYNVTDKGLNKMYHPSDIDIYAKSKSGLLGDPKPPNSGLKNPMAMRTMHELRKLVNYLLEIKEIDADTRVIVEIARELNDTNKRWAIQAYQKNREEENKEFAKIIVELAKEKYPNLNENNAVNVDKIRLWWEQLEEGSSIYKQVKELKEDVQKYRLWKEQECMCMYTGKMINLVNLFDGATTHFEHTLHLSRSFDDSLINKTVSDADYNTRIKQDQVPFKLKNYREEWNGYSPILPRLEKWIAKRNTIRDRIDDYRLETKKAIRKGDIERKNDLIRKRQLLEFDYEYWMKKINTFTVEEVPVTWKKSQLVDTQIISKYARAYLKTVFNRVEVQKGSVTAEFRRIFGISGEEKKDRSQHSHHAIDAAVLTLIPGSAKRDEVLRQYYEAIENRTVRKNYPIKPIGYEGFSIDHVLSIKEKTLVNHVFKDQTLNKARKRIRKRGKVVEFLDSSGQSSERFMEGDSIRGQLHLESFLGAIKPNERNYMGYAVKENGRYKIKQNGGVDDIWIVIRKPIEKVNFEKDVIVDELLGNYLRRQIQNGGKIEALVDFNGRRIRHIRCRYAAGRGFLSKEKAIAIKTHTFTSKFRHKHEYLVQNADNYLYLLYEWKAGNGKVVRGYKILNRMDIVQGGIKSLNDVRASSQYQIIVKKKGSQTFTLSLKAILRVGDKVILCKSHEEEIADLDLKQRMFVVFKFNEPAPSTGYVYLQHHLEARTNEELAKLEEKEFDPSRYQPRIFLNPDKMNFLLEHYDFSVDPDGTIRLL